MGQVWCGPVGVWIEFELIKGPLIAGYKMMKHKITICTSELTLRLSWMCQFITPRIPAIVLYSICTLLYLHSVQFFLRLENNPGIPGVDYFIWANSMTGSYNYTHQTTSNKYGRYAGKRKGVCVLSPIIAMKHDIYVQTKSWSNELTSDSNRAPYQVQWSHYE